MAEFSTAGSTGHRGMDEFLRRLEQRVQRLERANTSQPGTTIAQPVVELLDTGTDFTWDFDVLTASATLIADGSLLYMRVLNDGAVGRTLTLPNPANHLLPIWVRSLAAPAGGHTLARAGSEDIDGSGADVTMGTAAGQSSEILLISDGTDWYSLARKTH